MNRGVLFQYFEWNSPEDGSLWRNLAADAQHLKQMGVTAVWMPPAQKSMSGTQDTGYGVYDLYDLGEFDQKGTVRTKYGTKDEYLAAIKALHDADVQAYADVVLNHRMGGDEKEKVMIQEVPNANRNDTIGDPYEIEAWSIYNFKGRGGKYSSFTYNHTHFNAFGANAAAPQESGKIYRLVDKTFSGEVDFEFGNFDYLMGADVDHYNEEVRQDLFAWGKWFVDTTGVDGFRLDAVKHIPASFYKDWFAQMREHFNGRELFGVGEYWSANLDDLNKYIDATEGVMRLFDVPLHFNLRDAGEKGRDYDLTKVFDGTLVAHNPLMAVTFVDNHDSQPGQSLQSWVADWFKPLAYALILLREHGYPVVFYGDYYGNPSKEHGLLSHRKLIDDFCAARATHTNGELHDYFDHPQCVAWAWTGSDENPKSMGVVLSTGDDGTKRMKIRPNTTYHDVTGHIPEPVTTDENGDADFRCPAGKVSVWCD
ncbi:MAG: alpha-amylase [Tepidisphaeraceae bacterium]